MFIALILVCYFMKVHLEKYWSTEMQNRKNIELVKLMFGNDPLIMPFLWNSICVRDYFEKSTSGFENT